tara:strand:+ start:817 stop:1857 length:1041 start_codon:yes stop_codon:yes gene_type:complete
MANRRHRSQKREIGKDFNQGDDTRAAIDTAIDASDEKQRVRDEQAEKFAASQDRKGRIHVAGTPIQNPVHIFLEGKWVIVDNSAFTFPHPVHQIIDAEWAMDVLNLRNIKNRKFKAKHIERYKTEILDDKWFVTNQGIGFYTDGTLADGQNRLWAIAESEITTSMIVVYGIDPKALTAIDEGAIRTSLDVARMMDLDPSKGALPTAKLMLCNIDPGNANLPRHSQLQFYRRHAEAIHFATESISRRGISKAAVYAVIAKAWYYEDKARLKEFMDVLQTGLFTDIGDQAAHKLREWLIDQRANNSGVFREEVYQKVQSALVAFLDRKPCNRLYRLTKEQWLLPEEKK